MFPSAVAATSRIPYTWLLDETSACGFQFGASDLGFQSLGFDLTEFLACDGESKRFPGAWLGDLKWDVSCFLRTSRLGLSSKTSLGWHMASGLRFPYRDFAETLKAVITSWFYFLGDLLRQIRHGWFSKLRSLFRSPAWYPQRNPNLESYPHLSPFHPSLQPKSIQARSSNTPSPTWRIMGLSKQGYKQGNYSYTYLKPSSRYLEPYLLSPMILQVDPKP